MGRKSRKTWERRRTPVHRLGEPLETRWGTTPLARAFGGMVKGLMLGGGIAVVCLGIGALRMLAAGASPDMEGFAADLARVAGGFLLGGAVGGAAGPIRHHIGGRRAQGIAMAAVALLVWMPVVDPEGELSRGQMLFLGATVSVIHGLMFAKLFRALEPDPPRAQVKDMDPEFRSGRHREFR